MFVDLLKSFFRFIFNSTEGPEKPVHQSKPQYPHSAQQTVPWTHQVSDNNEYYISLRAQANEHGDHMAKSFQQSHEAYNRGDGALAKQLSNEGKQHQRRMEEYNRQASDWIFRENNKDNAPGYVDLHGLYVKEAIARTDEAITQAKRDGRSELRFIVGKGLHSQGGIAKIKPAIEDLIDKHHLKADLDPHNEGVLVVEIEAPSGQRGLGADEISRGLQRKDDGCTIM